MTPRIFLPSRLGFVRSCSVRFLSCSAGILAVLGAATAPRSAAPARRSRAAWAGAMPTARCRRRAYHAAFADFYDGDYRSALERFKAESRGVDQDLAVALDRLDLLRNDAGRVLLPDGRSTRRPWPITRPPWKSTRPFPPGCPRSSFSRSAPTSAGRSRPPGRSAGCKPRWASCPTPCHWGRGRSTPRRSSRRAGSSSRPTCFPSSRRRSFAARRWPSAAAASCSDRWPPTIR